MWPFENDDYPEGHLLLPDQGKPNNPRRYYARPHGVAVLHYRDGEPFAADNIRLPDGSRGKARLAPRTSHWRRPLNDQKRAWTSAATAIPIHWRWGALIVAPDDLIFEDNQSLPEISFDGRNERFDRDLCQSQEIKDLALTVEGCHALYTELRSGVWMPFSKTSLFSKTSVILNKDTPHIRRKRRQGRSPKFVISVKPMTTF
ncbi:hypothetical protein [Ensifer sp. B1-9]|uniref:hypothetical protein n=1 Tax=Ensifer sp. B1-9 TaxID=3141455 RepID=UPI003D1FC3A7